MSFLTELIKLNAKRPPIKAEKKKTDSKRTIRELVESRGFKFESHEIKTSDGYFLTLQRINKENRYLSSNHLKPVLMQHGLGCNSLHWIINSEENVIQSAATSNSLAFALAKEGYDVWLGNFRGSR